MKYQPAQHKSTTSSSSSSSSTGSSRSHNNKHKKIQQTKSITKRHKYKGLNERVDEIKINTNRLIQRVYSSDSDDDISTSTNIHNTQYEYQLNNILQLDQTSTFHELYNKLIPYKGDLAILMHNKHTIIQLLLDYLRQSDIIQYNSIFLLLNAIISDLTIELYKNDAHTNYIHVIIDVLLFDVLPTNLQNIPLVQLIFNTVSHLFIICHKYIKRHIIELYDRYIYKLIGHDKHYIRQYISEILSVQLRQLSSTNTISQYIESIQHIVLPPDNDITDERSLNNYISGIAVLFSMVIKSIEHTFHSSTSIILPILIDVLTSHHHILDHTAHDEYTCKFHQQILYELFVQLLEHTRGGSCDVIWSVLHDTIQQCCNHQPFINQLKLTELITVLNQCIQHRHSSRVSHNTTQLIHVLHILFHHNTLQQYTDQQLYTVLVELMSVCCTLNNPIVQQIVNKYVIDVVKQSSLSVDSLQNLLHHVVPHIQSNTKLLHSLCTESLNTVQSSITSIDNNTDHINQSYLQVLYYILTLDNNIVLSQSISDYIHSCLNNISVDTYVENNTIILLLLQIRSYLPKHNHSNSNQYDNRAVLKQLDALLTNDPTFSIYSTVDTQIHSLHQIKYSMPQYSTANDNNTYYSIQSRFDTLLQIYVTLCESMNDVYNMLLKWTSHPALLYSVVKHNWYVIHITYLLNCPILVIHYSVHYNEYYHVTHIVCATYRSVCQFDSILYNIN